MAQFINMYPVELNKGTAPIVPLKQMHQNNHKANRVGAIVTMDGAAYSLGGTCAGTAIRADGNTVPLTGTINGNQAYVELDSTCYAVPGVLIVTVTWVNSSEQTTLLRAVGTVEITSTGSVIQPTTPIPDLEQLLAQIETLQSATADAETAAAAMLAIDCEIPASFESGNITNSGTTTTSNTRIKSTEPILIKPGMWWNVDTTYEAGVAIFSGNEFSSANFVAYVGGSASTWYNGNIVVPAEYVGKYMGIRIEKIGHTSEDISGDVPTIGNYVKLNDPDLVLSKNNFYDYFVDEREQYLPERHAPSFQWEMGRRVNDNGTESSSNYAALTKAIPVTEHTVVQNRTPAQDADSHVFNVFVAQYKNGTFFSRTQIPSGEIFTTADDVDSIKLMAIYPSTEDTGMTVPRLNSTFAVGMVLDMVPGDGERPVYAAFGASTTVGAIHHYTGENVTYTPYAPPDYVGQVLGMDTYNLGQGTTGFMARDDGKKPNFMDQIYRNGTILQNANLITLTFGYGNDQTAGLTFGEWDDYFPYDTEGQFFADGATSDNQAGVTTMLSHGATLMGCLNWCIKWIGDHYPKATLVIIWGAPSENAQKKITLGNNSASGAGTSGIAPKKISITPTADSLIEYDETVTTLMDKLNTPFINLVTDELPFSYWSSIATSNGEYAVFSTKGTPEAPTWNSHPNEDGYKIFARYLAGRVSNYFIH